MTAVLSIDNVSKAFAGTHAVSGASLTIASRAIHGLIGPNGAGKTTLLNIVSGFVKPDSGTVSIGERDVTGNGAASIAQLGLARTFQDGRLLDDLTVADNLWVGRRLSAQRFGRRIYKPQDVSERQFIETLRLETIMHAPVKELSAGQRKAVEIGRALLATPTLLLLDEPFSGLTKHEIGTLIDTIRELSSRHECAILLVEHNLGAVFDVCEDVTAMDSGHVLLTGNSEDVRTSADVERAFFGSVAKPSVQVPARPSQGTDGGAVHPTSESTPRLRIDRVSAGYGRLEVVHNVSIDVFKGEIVGLAGVNGAGKTTLLRAISGLQRLRSGQVAVDGSAITARQAQRTVRTGISCVSQNRNLFQSLTTMENLRIAAKGARIGRREREERIAHVISDLPTLTPLLDRRAGLLSGGQKQLLAIARGLICDPQVLLLDEPSTGLSVGALEELAATFRVLADKGVAILVAEQNVAFVAKICDRGCVLHRGEIVGEGSKEMFNDVWDLVVA